MGELENSSLIHGVSPDNHFTVTPVS